MFLLYHTILRTACCLGVIFRNCVNCEPPSHLLYKHTSQSFFMFYVTTQSFFIDAEPADGCMLFLPVPSLASRKRKLFISLLITVVLTSNSDLSLLLACMFCCWWNQILNPGASSSKCCIAFSNIPCLCYLIHIMLVLSWILELHPGGEKNKF